jgi:hypothetical protein
MAVVKSHTCIKAIGISANQGWVQTKTRVITQLISGA